MLVIELGALAWDNGNTNNGDGWKQIGSSLRLESPSSISSGFEELKLFLLEFDFSGSGPDQ